MLKSLEFPRLLVGASATLTVAFLAAMVGTPAAAQTATETLGLGRAALPEEIAAWDVAVLPDGTGLKPGSGDVETGEEVFSESCASCHGDFAEGLDSWPVLAGGMGTLTDSRPVKTVGSYWPYLSTVFDYVHRSMPFGSAQTISVDDTYAIAAFLLYSNGLVEDDFVLSNENFTEITMPNADGFYVDDRPEAEYPLFSVAPCMTECAPATVEVTKRAVLINVTPQDPDGRPAGTMPDIRSAAETVATPAEPEAEAEPPAEAEGPVVDAALIEQGQKAFKQCAACHKLGEGAKNSIGPVLNGIVGHPVGTIEGFGYSKVLIEAGEGGMVWDHDNLSAYLANPKKFLPKNKMSFAGVRKPEDITALIAYLETFGN